MHSKNGVLMSLAKIPNRTDYVDEVYKSLLDAISAGILAPGERITQEDLAEKLNVSRSPVLQALRLLTQLDPTSFGHLYQVRGSLDGLAARLAATRQAKIPLSLIEDGRKASAGHDVNALIDADTAFHKAIYEASGNPFIVESAMLHWIHLRRVMGAVHQHQSGRSGIWDEHAAIVQAIHDGNAELAAALSEKHTDLARESLMLNLSDNDKVPARMKA
jgi:DNA-binding GntR family transcriptional regulator